MERKRAGMTETNLFNVKLQGEKQHRRKNFFLAGEVENNATHETTSPIFILC
jgi:hypothetical protein